jgi:rhodopsin domain-containing protein
MFYKRIFSPTAKAATPHKYMMGMVVVWLLFSFFALAFECDLPKQWYLVMPSCPTYGRLAIAVMVLNIVTDAVLVAFVWACLWNVSMPKSEFLTVLALFTARLL